MDRHLGVHDDPNDWEIEPFVQQVHKFFGFDPEQNGFKVGESALSDIASNIIDEAERRYETKEQRVTSDQMRQFERHILLQVIDGAWKDHLLAMDHLKEGIGLRAYGQRDPLVEYKKESFDLFSHMMLRIEIDAIRYLFLFVPITEEEQRDREERRRREQEQIFSAASRSASGVTARGGIQPKVRKTAKVGRNAPCPCGSGKKYKKCHGKST